MVRRARLAGGLVLLGLLVTLAASSGPAFGDVTLTCGPLGSADACSSFTVPNGVNFVTFTIDGAAGGTGGCTGALGGSGQQIMVTVNVSPGQTYNLYAGAKGNIGACGNATNAGGLGGVGYSGTAGNGGSGDGISNGGGGGGGGDSVISLGTTVLYSAAGGGGGGGGLNTTPTTAQAGYDAGSGPTGAPADGANATAGSTSGGGGGGGIGHVANGEGGAAPGTMSVPAPGKGGGGGTGLVGGGTSSSADNAGDDPNTDHDGSITISYTAPLATLPATSVTATSAILNGTDPNADSYSFDWDLASNNPPPYANTTTSATATSGTLTSTLTGLKPSTTYGYRIDAASGVGDEQTFTTLALPVTGSARAVGTTTAILQGTDTNTGESYHFEWGTTTAYGNSTPAATAAAGTLTATLSGLARQTTYHFRIVSAAGDGSDATFTTSGLVDAGIALTGPTKGKVNAKLSYTVTFKNTGTATISLPLARIQFLGRHHKVKVVTRHGCTGTGTLTCRFPALAPGGQRQLVIAIRSLHTGKLTVRSSVVYVGNVTDPTPKDDQASHVTKITAKASKKKSKKRKTSSSKKSHK